MFYDFCCRLLLLYQEGVLKKNEHVNLVVKDAPLLTSLCCPIYDLIIKNLLKSF